MYLRKAECLHLAGIDLALSMFTLEGYGRCEPAEWVCLLLDDL